jgi:hypothetical protein
MRESKLLYTLADPILSNCVLQVWYVDAFRSQAIAIR